MIRRYLTLALRQLKRNRLNSILNISGLGLGIAAFCLIWEYVAFERSVDQFHQNLPNLYRVLLEYKDGRTRELGPGPLAPDAKANFPDVAAVCRVILGAASGIVTVQPPPRMGRTADLLAFREGNAALVDGSFFSLFSFQIRSGNPASLNRPNVVFLSETTAKRYFGATQAVGQTVMSSGQFGQLLYTVGGVYVDMPENSDMRFDLLFSLKTLANAANRNGNDWADTDRYLGNFLQAVLLLKPGTDPDALARKMTALYHRKKPGDTDLSVRLQPSANVHLGRSLTDSLVTTGSLSFVYLLSALALLILLIAWLNYVNLSTTTALTRAKEIGVRKVVGATQTQLVGQLLGESLLTNALGLALGLLLLTLVQPVFNQLVSRQLSLGTLLVGRAGEVGLWFWGLLILLAGALVSGGYVAATLMHTHLITKLRGTGLSVGQTAWRRHGLVVVQFGIAVVLIVVTMVLFQQVRFLQNRPLGLTLNRLLTIRSPEVGKEQPDYKARRSAFRQQVAQLAFVEAWSNAGSVPGNYYNFNTAGVVRQTPRPGDENKTYNVVFVDHRFLPTFGIRLVAGQNFSPAQTETNAQTGTNYEQGGFLLLNERAAQELGFASANAAVGQPVVWNEGRYEVVGVVTNYRHLSPKTPVEALILFPRSFSGYLTLRLAPGDRVAQLTQLERLYKASFPGNPFDYFAVATRYNEQYQTEQQYGQLFSVSAGLAIFIACLGLFGLAAFTAQRRSKEIAVRKVLGATEASIVVLLAAEFLRSVGIAFVVVIPIAWWLADNWLQNFAEKTPLHWWIFAGAGLLALLITLLTVSTQSIRAAVANPVDSLRSE